MLHGCAESSPFACCFSTADSLAAIFPGMEHMGNSIRSWEGFGKSGGGVGLMRRIGQIRQIRQIRRVRRIIERGWGYINTQGEAACRQALVNVHAGQGGPLFGGNKKKPPHTRKRAKERCVTAEQSVLWGIPRASYGALLEKRDPRTASGGKNTPRTLVQ